MPRVQLSRLDRTQLIQLVRSLRFENRSLHARLGAMRRRHAAERTELRAHARRIERTLDELYQLLESSSPPADE